MDLISNVRVYGLEESLIASSYPMLSEPLSQEEFEEKVSNPEYRFETSASLASAPLGSGHSNFLKGIVVQFDLAFTNKVWVEAERYHWFDIVSSMSTMHRIHKLDLENSYNKYVRHKAKENMMEILAEYNSEQDTDKKKGLYLELLYNNPAGLMLTSRMTTNYLQLRTIYFQRRNHKLPEWREFCEWVETLPMAKELITGVRS